jgi:hypothetical protein
MHLTETRTGDQKKRDADEHASNNVLEFHRRSLESISIACNSAVVIDAPNYLPRVKGSLLLAHSLKTGFSATSTDFPKTDLQEY